MKAMLSEKYGSPYVLELKEVENPIPKDYEILIEVCASSINTADWHFLRGKPLIMRIVTGLLKPKINILGADLAGKVAAVGKNVKQYHKGDEVFGDLSSNGFGAFAEYVCVEENAAIASKPAEKTFGEVAALPLAAVTALQSLRDKGKVQPGQKVLVNGASGAVGTFTIQIAKSFGAEVTGVCSTDKIEMVRSIGADHIIDYKNEDFTNNSEQYNLIIDNVGNRSVSEYKRALSPEGKCVIVGFTTFFLLFQHAIFGGKKVGLMGSAKPNKKDLVFIRSLLEEGKIKPVIDRQYKLSEVPEAIRYVEKGHAIGKVVITV